MRTIELVNKQRVMRLAVALSLVAAACGDDDDDDGVGQGSANESGTTAVGDTTGPTEPSPSGEGRTGGTLVWAHEQEPSDLHLDDPVNNLSVTSWIRQSLLEGLYGHTGDLEFFPELLAEDGEVVENADGSVTINFRLRDGLMWSDGEPLTADDVKFTFDTVMATDANGESIYLIQDRTGYETITAFEVTSDTEFSITWSAFYSGFRTLFERVYPAHVFAADPAAAAAELNEHLRDWTTPAGGVIPSSGPLVFDSWQRGVRMSLVRNDRYHGSASPDVVNTGPAHVDGVTINWVADTDAQINALKAGEAHFIWTQPQVQFEELTTDDDFTIAINPGPSWEHWGFNLFNRHLAKPEVREAIALAIDKPALMADLYTPLYGDALPPEGLGNAYWMTNQEPYEDHAGDAGYGKGDIDAATAKLEEAGYVRDGDVYTHPEDGRLSLRVGTTGGNRLRELQQQTIQSMLAEAGIETTIDNVEGGDYFNQRPFSADALACANSGGTEGNCDIWDIVQFAWVGGPWPGSVSSQWRTGTGNNIYGYSNPDFDRRSEECDAMVDDAERADCYNELDRYITTLETDPNGLLVVPITQKPQFFAVRADALASVPVAPDTNDAGPLVNVVDYQLAE